MNQQNRLKLMPWSLLSILVILLAFSRSAIAAAIDTPNQTDASSWQVTTSFVVVSGSVNIFWSYDNYSHKALTSGYNRPSTPIQVKVKARSYELSNTHPTPCQDRSTSQVTGSGQISVPTPLASSLPCGGSPTPSGWHQYLGKGYHWAGGYYGETDLTN